MALMTNLICGPDREHFDFGANVEWAGDLLDEVLAGFPDTRGLTQDTPQQLAIAAAASRDLAMRAGSRYKLIRYG
jgi:hypothetical protein